MMKKLFVFLSLAGGLLLAGPGLAEVAPAAYVVGVNDILEVSVLEPETFMREVKVAPDGTITFPYVGSIKVSGDDVPAVQKKVQDALANGYLKYPVVLVSLKESNSKQYMVYGEVNRPGTYPMEEYSSVFRAISIAGGFTKFGSSSRVKVLRPRKEAAGYDAIKIDIGKVMAGDSNEDVQLKPGDMIVVQEGAF
jgi:polysaccharide export outer membrane protein